MEILVEGYRTGKENMERDLELLERGEPVVRLYGWEPEAVSLGRSQTEEVVDLEVARSWGIDVVQRPTGGGAILHNRKEVTYAVVLPVDFPGLPRDVRGSFEFLSRGVLLALQALGLPARIETVEDDRAHEPLCYVRRQGTNIVVRGRKISGGAQRRTPRSILQHGTVIVQRDSERMARLLRTDPDLVRKRVTSLETEGVEISREKLLSLLSDSFERALRA